MAQRPVEVWGITKTMRRGEHIQSYFLYFTEPALRSRAFDAFWSSFRPATDRKQAIALQEIGISTRMREAGFQLGSYFEPTHAEQVRAARRGAHWLRRRRHAFPAKFLDMGDSDFDYSRRRDPAESRHLNPASAYADSVFDHERYPLVKFDTLRYDPYWLGSAASAGIVRAALSGGVRGCPRVHRQDCALLSQPPVREPWACSTDPRADPPSRLHHSAGVTRAS